MVKFGNDGVIQKAGDLKGRRVALPDAGFLTGPSQNPVSIRWLYERTRPESGGVFYPAAQLNLPANSCNRLIKNGFL